MQYKLHDREPTLPSVTLCRDSSELDTYTVSLSRCQTVPPLLVTIKTQDHVNQPPSSSASLFCPCMSSKCRYLVAAIASTHNDTWPIDSVTALLLPDWLLWVTLNGKPWRAHTQRFLVTRMLNTLCKSIMTGERRLGLLEPRCRVASESIFWTLCS